MTDDRREIWDLLADVLTVPSADRSEYLDRVCPASSPRRAEVEALLAYESDAREPLAGPGFVGTGSRLGAYRLEEEIGRGGQAVVFAAVDERVGRRVAVKVLHGGLASRTAMARFRREAEITSNLDHPGICPVFEVGLDGQAFIAMRLVRGRPLSRALPLPKDEALAVIEKLARALHAAHEAGVIHRDVKPGNVMLGEDGEPVILDFGLASRATEATLTRSGDVMGTPAYMSPEQVRGARVDRRTDVYSLGAVLFEALTGVRPFERSSVEQTYLAVLNDAAPDVRQARSGLSKDVDVVLRKTLDKAPDRRYSTAADLADELVRLREGRPIVARPLSVTTRALRWSRRNPAAVVIMTATLVVALVVLYTNGKLERTVRARDEALTEYERLADVKRLEIARNEAFRLWPPRREILDDLLAWQKRHADLVARLDDHRQALENLAASAAPYDDAARRQQHARILAEAAALENERREAEHRMDDETLSDSHVRRLQRRVREIDLRLASIEERSREPRSRDFGEAVESAFRYESLQELVRELAYFAEDLDGAWESVAWRVEVARRLHDESVTRHADAWAACRRRVLENPAYRGFDLPPQEGFIPLGPDPDSELEEFLHLATHCLGAPLPERGRDGRFAPLPTWGVILVMVPPGEFVAGAQNVDHEKPNFDRMATRLERPLTPVSVEVPYFLSKYELTRAQWARCEMVDDTPSGYPIGFFHQDPTTVMDGTFPVESVSCEHSRLALLHVGLRLPNEYEWEYGARAGGMEIWSGAETIEEIPEFGNIAGREVAGLAHQHEPSIEDAYRLYAAVGSFEPNAWGLHDMTGNVSEWTSSLYEGRNVIRGGSHDSNAFQARTTLRSHVLGSSRDIDRGLRPAFRLVLP